jgi:hypothetical protein
VKFPITGSPRAGSGGNHDHAGAGQAYIHDRNKLKFYPGNALSV